MRARAFFSPDNDGDTQAGGRSGLAQGEGEEGGFLEPLLVGGGEPSRVEKGHTARLG